jgi:hypothetical protein
MEVRGRKRFWRWGVLWGNLLLCLKRIFRMLRRFRRLVPHLRLRPRRLRRPSR